MKPQRLIQSLCALFVLAAFTLLSACSRSYGNEDFTFSPLAGFKTKEFSSTLDSHRNAEYLLFTQNSHVYFQIFRQQIPQGSDLNSVIEASISKASEGSTNYQFISKNSIEVNDQQAIEAVYREFHGEPYVQIVETWMEHNGMAYTLLCSEPVIATPGLVLPVAEQCYKLVDGFKFK